MDGYIFLGAHCSSVESYLQHSSREGVQYASVSILSLHKFIYIYYIIITYTRKRVYTVLYCFCSDSFPRVKVGYLCICALRYEMGGTKGSLESPEDFLKQCQPSGDAAYAALRSILERLEDPATRAEARIFLAELQERFKSKEDSDRCLQTYHFQIQDLYLEQNEGPCIKCAFA